MIKKQTEVVPASEFARNFGRYKLHAQRAPVAVSSHGRIAGYFVPPEDYEDLLRLRAERRSFASRDLSPARAKAIARTRMDPRHDHLNDLLDKE